MLSMADPSMMNLINDRLNKDRASASSLNNMSSNLSVSSGGSSGSEQKMAQFPITLHHLLSDASIQGFDDVISWLPGGTAFKIHDPKRFTEEIMP